MLQTDVHLTTDGAITGQSDSQIILHYSRATRKSRKQAVSVLENFLIGNAEVKKRKDKKEAKDKKKKAS